MHQRMGVLSDRDDAVEENENIPERAGEDPEVSLQFCRRLSPIEKDSGRQPMESRVENAASGFRCVYSEGLHTNEKGKANMQIPPPLVSYPVSNLQRRYHHHY